MPIFLLARESGLVDQAPPYLEVRHDVLAARVVRAARREVVMATCDEQPVIEYYAR